MRRSPYLEPDRVAHPLNCSGRRRSMTTPRSHCFLVSDDSAYISGATIGATDAARSRSVGMWFDEDLNPHPFPDHPDTGEQPTT